MCAVSFVGDHYGEKWSNPSPWFVPNPLAFPPTLPMPLPAYGNGQPFVVTHTPITREEFDALRADVLEMKALLIRAKEYDERTGQPHCEQEDKIALLKKVAEMVGISLEEVFGK